MSWFKSFLPEQASTLAGHVDAVYQYLVLISIFFTLLIFALVFFFAFRYRRRHDDERPKAIHGSNLLEAIWTFIPFVIAMSIFAWGTLVFFQNMRPPANAMEIFVVGKQWMWKIQHPEGPREINELHIPVGRPVKLKMTSEDVIHSFFVPAFRTKMDVLPGKYTTTWFEATKPGRYHLFCTEYCGTEHAGMKGSVIAMEQEDYAQWLSEKIYETKTIGGASLAEEGEALFDEFRCVTCHNSKSGAMGPNLEGVYGTQVKLSTGKTVAVDDAYVRESILNPGEKLVFGYNALMPTFKNQISEEQIISIIAYLKSLAPQAAQEEAREN